MFFLAACRSVPSILVSSTKPAIAIRLSHQSVYTQSLAIQDFRVVDQGQWNDAIVTVFTFQYRTTQGQVLQSLGYTVLEEQDKQFVLTHSKMSSGQPIPRHITYDSDQVKGWTLIYGCVYDGGVATIEAIGAGTTPKPNGGFWTAKHPIEPVTQLVLQDAHRQRMKEYNHPSWSE
jgi:hypothetical protein